MHKQAKFYCQKILRDVLLLTSLGVVLLLAPPASPQTSTKLSGELWVSGNVEVNGKTATTGQTIFSSYKIKTKENSSATINLGKQVGRIKLEPESEMIVSFTTELIGGHLRRGVAILTVPLGVAINVTTAAGVVVSKDRLASTLALEAKPDETSVAAARGEAEIKANGKTEHVTTGEEVTITISAGTRRRRGGGLLLLGGAAPALAVGLAGVGTVGVTGVIVGSTPSEETPPPVTPVGLTRSNNICNCFFNASNGESLNPRQATTICHTTASGQRQTLSLSCASIAAHFNSDGSARTGHQQDTCGACANN